MLSRLQPWITESSTYPLSDRWIRVRADHCHRSNGATVSPYYVLENSDWVAVFAVTQQLDVILVTEYHHGAGVIGLGLPGGGTSSTSESPLAAAHRELLEETGYEPGTLESVGSGFANWANQTNRVHYVLALDCVLVAPQDLDENEEIEVSLMPLADFDPKKLQQSYHLAAALLSTQRLATLNGT